MKATKLKQGEHYAYRAYTYGATVLVELLSTEPHRPHPSGRNRPEGEPQFVPGRLGRGIPTYPVRHVTSNVEHLVQARYLLGQWDEFRAEQARRGEERKAERLKREEYAAANRRRNEPLVNDLVETHRHRLSPESRRSILNVNLSIEDPLVRISLSDLAKLAGVAGTE